MNNFNRAMIALDEEFQFVSSSKQYISCQSESEKVSNHSFASLLLYIMPGAILIFVQHLIFVVDVLGFLLMFFVSTTPDFGIRPSLTHCVTVKLPAYCI